MRMRKGFALGKRIRAGELRRVRGRQSEVCGGIHGRTLAVVLDGDPLLGQLIGLFDLPLCHAPS